jgi:hypothetical protein
MAFHSCYVRIRWVGGDGGTASPLRQRRFKFSWHDDWFAKSDYRSLADLVGLMQDFRT